MARHSGLANVHSFEYFPGNIPKLHENLRLNHFYSVSVHDLALADRDGLVQLNASDGDSTASISPNTPSSEDDLEGWVSARRLDSYRWPAQFAYIKIDVEGAEQLVLQGSEQLLLQAPPMVWSFEWLNTKQRLGSSKAALLEAFARWQYQCFLYRPATNRLVPFITDADGSCPRRDDDNVLAIHASAIDAVARRLCGVSAELN